jgi:hypothetical protein
MHEDRSVRCRINRAGGTDGRSQCKGGRTASRVARGAYDHGVATDISANSVTHPLTTWTPSQGAAATFTAVIAEHRLAELELFSDASIVDVIDRHPRSLLEIFAPIDGSRAEAGWRSVAVGDASGEEVLAAVEHGRLWVLLPRVHLTHPGFASLQEQLSDELAGVVPEFAPQTLTSTLLVSSPTASVPYHLDGIPNLLWHVRGEKRIFLYPPDVDEFVDPRVVEDIIIGESPEYLGYNPDFESAASTLDLSPGQVLAIPHYAPHRVENLSGLNVSLNTELTTLRTQRRNGVRMANRFFSRRLHLPVSSRESTGVMARAKRASYRALRRAGFDRRHVRRPMPEPGLRIDPSAPDGVAPIEQPRPMVTTG